MITRFNVIQAPVAYQSKARMRLPIRERIIVTCIGSAIADYW